MNLITAAKQVGGALLVVASIYFPGDGLVKKNDYATASGIRYNRDAMTCAHKTLPMGTKLYLSHGKNHAEVTITDRGPYIKGRTLDCTPAVNKALHLGGLGKVAMQSWPPLPKGRPDSAPAGIYASAE